MWVSFCVFYKMKWVLHVYFLLLAANNTVVLQDTLLILGHLAALYGFKWQFEVQVIIGVQLSFGLEPCCDSATGLLPHFKTQAFIFTVSWNFPLKTTSQQTDGLFGTDTLSLIISKLMNRPINRNTVWNQFCFVQFFGNDVTRKSIWHKKKTCLEITLSVSLCSMLHIITGTYYDTRATNTNISIVIKSNYMNWNEKASRTRLHVRKG